ncbi:MAG: enolase C-terminal domain-like protein [Deltaproteobacteria bacterium]|nr:enolase C-terminal domain-like protein [Deltaproteobacteria bacterium]
MIVKKLDIWHLRLGFLSPIKHNLATHQGSDNLVVRVTTDEGMTGFGEGVPRAFVTGEVLSDSLLFLRQVLAPAILAREFPSTQALLQDLRRLYEHAQAQRHPAAFCALETALLDAAARTWDIPVTGLIGPKLRTSLEYSAVIPLMSPEAMRHLLRLVKMNQMRFVKLKVGTDDDLSTLRLVREELGDDVDIRVDANSAWTPAEAIERLKEMQPYGISAVEQPVAKADFAGLKQVSEAVQIPVIADESLCNEDDAKSLIDLKACRIFNIRISKCGGLGTATRISRMAEAAGIICQLGCHVGETSILAAAGRQFALTVPYLSYVEGSFSPYLLVRDVVSQPVVFNGGGMAFELPGPGLGIEVLVSALEALAVSHDVETTR